jgi:hypothetical protein
MCNCGRKRSQYAQQSDRRVATGNAGTPTGTPVRFEYIGNAALTIFGNVTGKRYRFGAPGIRQDIDHRDVPGISRIPVLKKITE